MAFIDLCDAEFEEEIRLNDWLEQLLLLTPRGRAHVS